MSTINTDIQILRELAEQYAEITHADVQEQKRTLWRQHNSLKPTRIPVLATYGMWNVWCREVFGDHAMRCEDSFYRMHERALRMQLFQYEVGDDSIQEPWITQGATLAGAWRQLWGVNEGRTPSEAEGGAWRFSPPLRTWDDMENLSPVPHAIDEEGTARNVARLQEAVGDILPVNIERGCAFTGFMGDISTSLAGLRGLEQVMEDMYDASEELHRLLAFMRDHILAVQHQAEAAGEFSLTTQGNQSMTYAEELASPRSNSGPRKRAELWQHCAAQEFTLISPAMHDEFLLHYQLPIIAQWGLVAYGCCEDLTRKIDMLRQVPNLRQIAVTPVADVVRCAEQIGTDYVFSWRPNPTDQVCCGFDEARIRQIIGNGLQQSRGCRVHIHLKDIETVEGDSSRLARWVRIVREVAEVEGNC
ncbi:MAG: hypothetical protein ACYDBB_09690 [Armatimonadota bacterium]